MLVSASEKSPFLRALGKLSDRPERFGCDVLAVAGGRWLGIQRKAIQDLLASLWDGRLTTERAQWDRLLNQLGGRVVLVVEGKMTWSTDGELMGVYGKGWNRRDYRRLVYSVQRQGAQVFRTDDQKDTAELIEDLIAYHNQKRTGSRYKGRPNPKGRWGTPSSRDWMVWVITSFGENIGSTRAEALLDHFGGRIPARWEFEYEELLEIPGWGKKTADQLWRALNPLVAVKKTKKRSKKEKGSRKRKRA